MGALRGQGCTNRARSESEISASSSIYQVTIRWGCAYAFCVKLLSSLQELRTHVGVPGIPYPKSDLNPFLVLQSRCGGETLGIRVRFGCLLTEVQYVPLKGFKKKMEVQAAR